MDLKKFIATRLILRFHRTGERNDQTGGWEQLAELVVPQWNPGWHER